MPSLSYLMLPMPPVSGSNTKSLQPGRGASRERALSRVLSKAGPRTRGDQTQKAGRGQLMLSGGEICCLPAAPAQAHLRLAGLFTPPSPDSAQLLSILRENLRPNLQAKGSTTTGRVQGGE